MRPSEFVTAVKAGAEGELEPTPEVEEMHVRVVITWAAGRPVVVSRTWQVMGSRAAMMGMLLNLLLSWEDMASRRKEGVVGIN